MVSAEDVPTALTTVEDSDWSNSSIKSIHAIEEGINDTYAVVVDGGDGSDSTEAPNEDQLVVKFATFSQPESLHAGVAAYRLLSAHADLPVPEIHAVSTGTTELPAFYVAERLPGDVLDDPTDPHDSVAARKMGQV
ncbi:MAG: aminoglycoside phosphotransferase family protein, partial [Halobacteriaceae archaeon]